MNRKAFLKTCGVACVSASAMATLFQSCSSANYFAASNISENKLTLNKKEFIKIVKENQTIRKYVLIKTTAYNFPICIYRISDNEYSALLMECTHKSCELNPQGNFLVCPCHGSEFSIKGAVQNPPAEQNLKTFITTTDNENIYVQL
jgi:cytochrome b6-f complex iron-sulfur subunit